MKRPYSKAFTILEVMIVLALVAVLTALAYGSYSDSVRKSHRGDAQAALTGFAVAMQRFYTEQTPSTYAGAAASGPPGPPASTVFPDQSPLDGDSKYYNLRVQSSSASAYELRAVPVSGAMQDDDKCGTLTLTSTGLRGINGGDAGVTWQDCWR